ncbi:Mobile element protein [Mesobacillus thioparans]
MRRLIKTAIKWGPVLYPIVKKMMDSRKSTKMKSSYSK